MTYADSVLVRQIAPIMRTIGQKRHPYSVRDAENDCAKERFFIEYTDFRTVHFALTMLKQRKWFAYAKSQREIGWSDWAFCRIKFQREMTYEP